MVFKVVDDHHRDPLRGSLALRGILQLWRDEEILRVSWLLNFGMRDTEGEKMCFCVL